MGQSLRHVTFGSSTLAARRRAKRSRRFVIWGVLALLLYGSLWWLAREDAFAVEEISVSGNVVSKPEAIEGAARGALASSWWTLWPATNVYLASKSRLAAAVRDAFPELSDVTVTREGNNLHVAVTERAAWAFWCRSGAAGAEECFALDAAGQIFAREDAPADALRFYGIVDGEPLRASYGLPETFASLKTLVESLRDLGLHPVKISADDPARFRVTLSEGPYLLVDATHDGALAARNLKVALGDAGLAKIGSLEYVDLRLERKVFLKRKGEAEESGATAGE